MCRCKQLKKRPAEEAHQFVHVLLDVYKKNLPHHSWFLLPDSHSNSNTHQFQHSGTHFEDFTWGFFAFVSTPHSTGFLKPALLFFHSPAFWKKGSARAQRIIKGLRHNTEVQSTPHNDAHLLLENLIGRNSIIPTISSYRPWSFHSVKSHAISFPVLISPSPYSKLVPWFKCRSSTMAGSLIN